MEKFRRISIAGLNIRWPWSECIVSGQKIIETRGYPLPVKHLGKVLAVIETGNDQLPEKRSSRIVGLVQFSRCYEYRSRTQWVKDFSRHCVRSDDSNYGYDPSVPKWAWEIQFACRVLPLLTPPKIRGIKFASNCLIPIAAIQYPKSRLFKILKASEKL